MGREKVGDEVDEHGEVAATIWEAAPGGTSRPQRTRMRIAAVSVPTFLWRSVTDSVTR
jgi:hypothetical protein